jgi:hypothetical protein
MHGNDGLAVTVALKVIEKGIYWWRLQLRHCPQSGLLRIAQRAKQVVGGEIAVFLKERAANLESMRDNLDFILAQYFREQIGVAIRNDAYFAHDLAAQPAS